MLLCSSPHLRPSAVAAASRDGQELTSSVVACAHASNEHPSVQSPLEIHRQDARYQLRERAVVRCVFPYPTSCPCRLAVVSRGRSSSDIAKTSRARESNLYSHLR